MKKTQFKDVPVDWFFQHEGRTWRKVNTSCAQSLGSVRTFAPDTEVTGAQSF